MERVGAMKAINQTGRDEFRRYWRRWTSIVELFARRRRARRRIGFEEYESLHAELLAACRALASAGPEKEQPLYRVAEQLAQPWLSPQTLELAEPEILFDLFLRSREAGRRLGCWTWVHALQRWSGMLVGLGATLLGLVLLASTSRLWSPVLDWLNDLRRALWLVLKRAGQGPWWFTVGVGVVGVVVLYLVSRRARA
jgi:hypothetical protein